MGLESALFLELGTWIGWLFARLGSRSQIQQALVMGTNAQRSFPIVDRQLERETISASSMQRKTAAGISRGIRFFAGTHACELAILKAVQEKWPGVNQDRVEVKLHL
jgi:hypothetical protein